MLIQSPFLVWRRCIWVQRDNRTGDTAEHTYQEIPSICLLLIIYIFWTVGCDIQNCLLWELFQGLWSGSRGSGTPSLGSEE